MRAVKFCSHPGEFDDEASGVVVGLSGARSSPCRNSLTQICQMLGSTASGPLHGSSPMRRSRIDSEHRDGDADSSATLA